MLDDVAIRQPVISKTGYINLVGATATTRKPDIGLTGFTGSVDLSLIHI